ncbi:MAG: cell division protein FtsA [Bacteroidetes bacterium]|nr:cell division protein FtsA [Bacteroidota bacterium]MCL2302719.1 cell division protein FtsA [Lentimicrobiaceae bacterium]
MVQHKETQEQPQIVVGLDIGTTKIAMIIGFQNSDGKIDVLGYGKGDSTGVQHGLIFNINKTVDGINVAKNTAISRSNQEFDSVYAGVAGRHINSMEFKHTVTRRNGKEEIIRQEEIDKMVEDLENISVRPGEKIITVIPQRFVIDGIRETTEPVGELGELIVGYFQIITGNDFEIKKIIRCINDCELTVNDIILEPIASSLVCLTYEEKQQGVVLVDIGGGTTDVVIYVDGNPVFTKVIPIGGSVITKDIANVCQIPEDLAEKLKISYGTCVIEKSNKNNFINIPQFHESAPKQISEPFLAEIIYSRVQMDILNQIQKAITESGYDKRIRAGVVLTGGGSSLRHLKQLCQYTLQRNTRIGIPDIGFVNSIPAELKDPMFATSLGLLKHGIQSNDLEGFEHEEEQKAEGRKQKAESKKDVGAENLPPKGKGRTKTDGGKKTDSGKNAIWDSIKKFLDGLTEKTS